MMKDNEHTFDNITYNNTVKSNITYNNTANFNKNLRQHLKNAFSKFKI